MDNCSLSKSDYMLCTNTGYLLYKDNIQNDTLFLQQMNNTRPQCVRNIDKESSMFINDSSKKSICTNSINTRGGNSLGCEPNKNCPSLYSSYSLNEFLLVPCPKNTYKNYLVFDDTKICSKSHQMLNNWTKRKELTGFEHISR